jgi:voltage-dependent calcium channel
MCVSGFLFDPEVPISAIFSARDWENSPTTPASASPSLSRQPSLSRDASIRNTLYKIQHVLLRPFTLAPAAKRHYSRPSLSSSTNTRPSFAAEKLKGAHDAFRDPSHQTYFSNIVKSDSEKLSLPFSLNVHHIRDQTRRNLPYLRHSWSRIDLVAIVSFWIAFGLAMAGLERGTHHIGTFRAMSVIRCARLLAVTTGTAVSRFGCDACMSSNAFLDHYAFVQAGSAASWKHGLLYLICHDVVFVSTLVHCQLTLIVL